MQFRWHRGSLADSMTTVVTVANRAELVAVLNEKERLLEERATEDNVAVKPYGFDKRINWDSHIVMIGDSVMGFTDGAM